MSELETLRAQLADVKLDLAASKRAASAWRDRCVELKVESEALLDKLAEAESDAKNGWAKFYNSQRYINDREDELQKEIEALRKDYAQLLGAFNVATNHIYGSWKDALDKTL